MWIFVGALGYAACGGALGPAVRAKDAGGLSEALENRGRQLRETLAERGFQVVIEPPFVVVGDESAERVQSRARGTIRWATERLQAEYFPRLPAHPIEIWLLKDADSYRRTSETRWGITPTTPFGYFAARHQAVVVDISTGAGTLVHELVHPLMAVNFPSCPAWFDEGLASLYEQCCDRDGKIWGLPNWRLRRLQRAIDHDALPTLAELCQTSKREFYADKSGMNYAQARYLCLYLQERGLLSDFFVALRGDHASDPTGYRTLAKLLGSSGSVDFQQDWEEFVRGL